MAVDYTGYPKNGEEYGLPYTNFTNVYQEVGFNSPIPKKFAYSYTKLPIAGGSYCYVQAEHVKRVNSGLPFFSLNFPVVKGAKVYNILARKTATGNAESTRRLRITINGYDTLTQELDYSYLNYDYTLNSNGYFITSYSPKNLRVRTDTGTTRFPYGIANSFPNIKGGKYFNGIARTDILFAQKMFQKANWNCNDIRQWTYNNRINNFLNYTYIALDNSNGVIGEEQDLSIINSVFHRLLDNGSTLCTLRYAVSPANSYNLSVTFDKTNGYEMTVTDNANDNESLTLRKIQNTLYYGNFPSNIPETNFVEVISNMYGVDNCTGYGVYFFNGKFYRTNPNDDEDFQLYDENGGLFNSNDFEQGGLFFACDEESDSRIIIRVYLLQHISQAIKLLASVGIPIMLPQIENNNFPLTHTFTGNDGNDYSTWYQSPVNTKTGECTADYVPLNTNPDKIQSITNPNDVDLKYDDNIEIFETPLEVPPAFYISKGVRTYTMGQGGFNELMEKLFQLPQSIFDVVKGFSDNISESIRNVTVFPFSVVRFAETVPTILSYYGENLVENVAELRHTNAVYDMGSYSVIGDGTFMDYEPYTQYYIFLPYVGMRKLDSRDVVDNLISVKYVIDFQTGECRANVFRGGVLLATYNGVCGINIPIVSRDYATIMSNVVNMASSYGSIVHSLADNTAQYIGSTYLGEGDESYQYDVNIPSKHEVIKALSSANIYRSSVAMNGEAGTTSAFTMPQYPFIIKIRSKYEIPDNYGHSVGYVCEESGNLGDYDGYTVCENVDLSGIPCLETEKALIKGFLETGVFL